MLDSFIQEQTNQVVSVDKVPANAGQSVQLIALWCQYIGLPYQWANPFDWWDDSDVNFSEHWSKVIYDPDNPEIRPRPGDIMVFDSSLPGSDGLGHLTLFKEELSDTSWVGFDANWGGKSAHTQSHSWAYVLGWFTPINPRVTEQPTTTPICNEAPSQGFEAIAHEAKLVVLQDGAPLYNLNDVSHESFKQNPISRAGELEEAAITATAQHRLGGTYLMPDINVPYGYSVLDCENYEAPQIITQDPMIKPDRFPARPAMVPSKEIIPISRTIPYYSKVSDAVKRQNPVGEVHANRTYFVYKRLEDVVLLAADPGRSTGYWINPKDMEEPAVLALPSGPVAEPAADWRSTYKAFRDKYGNVEPRWFAGITSGEVCDHEQRGRDLPILQNQPILIAGWFQGPDGEWYGRPDDAAQLFRWYGVDRNNLKRYSPPEPAVDDMEMRFEDDPTIVETLGGPVVVTMDVDDATPAYVRKMSTIVPGMNKVFDVIKQNKEKYYGNFIKRP